jgi:hypothetical protein
MQVYRVVFENDTSISVHIAHELKAGEFALNGDDMDWYAVVAPDGETARRTAESIVAVLWKKDSILVGGQLPIAALK